MQILIAEDIQTICALRIGLSVDGSESEHYRLLPLNFHQSFFKMRQTLSPKFTDYFRFKQNSE